MLDDHADVLPPRRGERAELAGPPRGERLAGGAVRAVRAGQRHGIGQVARGLSAQRGLGGGPQRERDRLARRERGLDHRYELGQQVDLGVVERDAVPEAGGLRRAGDPHSPSSRGTTSSCGGERRAAAVEDPLHAGPGADEHQPVRVGEGLRGVDELDRARDVDEPQRRQVDRDVGGGVGGAERGVERGLQHAPDLRPVGQVDLTREPQRGGRRSGDPQQRVVVQRGCDQLGGVDLAHRGHGLIVKEAPIEPAEHTGARMLGQQAVDGRLVSDELAQPTDRQQLAGLTREPDARPPLALGFADRLAHEFNDVGYGEGAELARALRGDDEQAAVGEGSRHRHPVVGEPAEQVVGGVVLEVDDALAHRETIRYEGGRGLPQVVLAVGDETGVPDATLVDRADPRHTHSLGVCL